MCSLSLNGALIVFALEGSARSSRVGLSDGRVFNNETGPPASSGSGRCGSCARANDAPAAALSMRTAATSMSQYKSGRRREHFLNSISARSPERGGAAAAGGPVARLLFSTQTAGNHVKWPRGEAAGFNVALCQWPLWGFAAAAVAAASVRVHRENQTTRRPAGRTFGAHLPLACSSAAECHMLRAAQNCWRRHLQD